MSVVRTAAFIYAVRRTLGAEGLWSDHQQDLGGPTKYGITENEARSHGIAVRDLTRDQAIDIYHADYWVPLRLDELASRFVAAEMFDTAVNMGKSAAGQIAQQACGLLGASVAVDGHVGEQTVAAINKLTERYEPHLIAALNGFQFIRYVQIHRSNPERHKAFIKGWMLRLYPPAQVFAMRGDDDVAVN